MTTTTKKKAYKFIVRGVYRGTDGRDKAKKFFEAEEFILPAHYTYPCGRKEVDKMKSDAEGKPMKVKTSVPLIKTEHILRCYKTVLKNYFRNAWALVTFAEKAPSETSTTLLSETIWASSGLSCTISFVKIDPSLITWSSPVALSKFSITV